jgi:ADP-ribosylglycohydrolase
MDPDALARRLVTRYRRDPARGYGGGAHRLLAALGEGRDWWEAAPALFAGGSYGNGAAMRAGPLGAYFADDRAALVDAARTSAAVTHAHDEGKAGAIAVALAASAACTAPDTLLEVACAHTPRGRTHEGLVLARTLGPDTPLDVAVERLGNGGDVAAYDTVPLALWVAAHHLRAGGFAEAMWLLVAARGDIDTTCAIAGSVLALVDAPPASWCAAREPLELELPRAR